MVSCEEFLILSNKTDSLANLMMLYYTHEWIENDPNKFLTLLTSIKSISELFNYKPICILVNYEYFGCNINLKDFYLYCKLVEYLNAKINQLR